MNQLDLIDIYRTFHPKTMNFTSFSSTHGTFSRIDHILGHKSSLDKFKKIEIISSIFSDHNAIRLAVHYRKDWSWSWNSKTLATSCKELTHWKRLWCWEGLGAVGERDFRGWDGWMASRTRWTRVWVNSGSWWWTGRPGVLRFMGLQRVGHDWATELNWTELTIGIPTVPTLRRIKWDNYLSCLDTVWPKYMLLDYHSLSPLILTTSNPCSLTYVSKQLLTTNYFSTHILSVAPHYLPQKFQIHWSLASEFFSNRIISFPTTTHFFF